MSVDEDTIPDDIHSLISLSSSTIGSNRLEDLESTDSQDIYNDDGTKERLRQIIDSKTKSMDKNFETESRIDSYRLDSPTKTDTRSELTKEGEELDKGTEDDQTDENPFRRSVKYLEEQGILRLFQSLAADIVYNRPEQPLQYIVEKLKEGQNDLDNENTVQQKSDPIPR